MIQQHHHDEVGHGENQEVDGRLFFKKSFIFASFLFFGRIKLKSFYRSFGDPSCVYLSTGRLHRTPDPLYLDLKISGAF